jgi:hypothetical protein
MWRSAAKAGALLAVAIGASVLSGRR